MHRITRRKLLIRTTATALVCLTAACSEPAPPASAIEAIEALKRLKARTDVGISYSEYLAEVAAALLAVRNAADDKTVAAPLKQALLSGAAKHQFAAAVWKEMLDSSFFNPDPRMLEYAPAMQEFIQKYPNVPKQNNMYFRPQVLSAIWLDADLALESAVAALSAAKRK